MPEELPSEPKNKILLPIISALYFIKAFWQMIQPPQNKKETIKKVDISLYLSSLKIPDGLKKQSSLEYSTITIDRLRFDFTVVPEKIEYSLRVAIHRSNKSDTDLLKISFLNSILGNFINDSDSFYLKTDEGSKVIFIPGRLLDDHSKILSIKVERFLL